MCGSFHATRRSSTSAGVERAEVPSKGYLISGSDGLEGHAEGNRRLNPALRDELAAMAEEDQRMRAELAADGSLFDGHHPRTKAVHDKSAARLSEIIDIHGWPGQRLVGDRAARAAWLILQHAIGQGRAGLAG